MHHVKFGILTSVNNVGWIIIIYVRYLCKVCRYFRGSKWALGPAAALTCAPIAIYTYWAPVAKMIGHGTF